MSQQTSYSRSFDAAFAGQPGDSGLKQDQCLVNAFGSDSPAGVLAVSTSTADQFTLPAAATDKLLGGVLNTFARNPGDASVSLTGAIPNGSAANIRSYGALWVSCEQAMGQNDPVYVRFTANGSGKLQVGAVRKDADGVAQVTTVTPTATNSLVYVLRVSFPNASGLGSYTFEYQADGSATATEIVTGFKTVMAADAVFTASVVASGTTTLILTGQTAGLAFTVQSEGDGAMAVAATTPPAAHARKVVGARVLTASTGAGVVQIHIDAAVDRAAV